jgi:choline dehydrogenase-like flavoprotein
VDERGLNPTWPGIGYEPAPPFPAHEARLNLSDPLVEALECDVCVVGSGAGGAVVAARAAHARRSVIVLEAGPGAQAPDYVHRELPGMRSLFMEQGLAGTRDLGIAILAGEALGGGTTVNWQTSLRLPDEVRDEWGEISGCDLFRDAAFDRCFDAVEDRLDVDTAESQRNPNNEALRRGCDALGYTWAPIPRNSAGCRPEECGYCMFGCRAGGKQSTSVTYLADAQAAGDARIFTGCRVERVLIEGGRAAGVEASAADPRTGGPRRIVVRARTIVVAGGGIQSPALLLRSGLRLPALGSNLFLHPTPAVGGVYPDAVGMWSGPPQTVVSSHFAHLEGPYGFRLECVPAHPGLMAMAMPWDGPREHRRTMQRYGRLASIIALVRDRESGRVTVPRGGRPVVDYRPGSMERRHLKRGIEAAARVHRAAGALEIASLHEPVCAIGREAPIDDAGFEQYCQTLIGREVDRNRSILFSAHQMGTCRMGTDPRAAVCNEQGEVFGVRGLFVADASLFPASSGVNPMLTVMALAHHAADSVCEA